MSKCKKKNRSKNKNPENLMSQGKSKVDKYLAKEVEISDNLYQGLSILYKAFNQLDEETLKQMCDKKDIKMRSNCYENAFIRYVWSDVEQDSIKESKLHTYGRCLRNMKIANIDTNAALDYLRANGVDKIANPRESVDVVEKQNFETEQLKNDSDISNKVENVEEEKEEATPSSLSKFLSFLAENGYYKKPWVFIADEQDEIYASQDETLANIINFFIEKNNFKMFHVNDLTEE